MTAMRQMEAISNNIANLSTPGYREQRVSFASLVNGVKSTTMAWSTEDGPLMTDGVQSHVALRGQGYFQLADGAATRDGRFQLNELGQLTTSEGTLVEGVSGPIVLPPGESFRVDRQGRVIGNVSGEVGQLKVVTLTNGVPLGGNRWSGVAQDVTAGFEVIQGAVEGSNANPLQAMAEMIHASRYFESQEKAIQTSDSMRERLNRIGG